MIFVPSPTIPEKERPPITLIVSKFAIDGLSEEAYVVSNMAKERKQWLSLPGERGNPKDYKCSYCGNQVGTERYYLSTEHIGTKPVVHTYIYICPRCTSPTYFDEENQQYPAPAFGEHIEDIPDIKEIIDLYDEARRAMSVGSHTAAAMCCRKLLMNMAEKKGAKENETYSYYVQYFLDKNYLHEDYKDWVVFIKDKGNEANHEIPEISRADAEQLITFVGMLIKILYEFNAKMSKASGSSDTP